MLTKNILKEKHFHVSFCPGSFLKRATLIHSSRTNRECRRRVRVTEQHLQNQTKPFDKRKKTFTSWRHCWKLRGRILWMPLYCAKRGKRRI